MSSPRKSRRPTLLRRLVYFIMLLSGGSAGVGGWMFKDHPRVQALLALATGKPASDAPDGKLENPVAAVVGLLEPTGDAFNQPGTFQVTIRQVHLDPNLFRAGRTVDIQAKVLRSDDQGHSTTLWDTVQFGEQLAVAGKDELIAEWDHRPFQVDWSPGDRLTVEVYDRRAGLFAQPKRFLLTAPNDEPGEFPLRPGTFPLEAESARPDPRVDPRNVKIVLQSRRVADPAPSGRDRPTKATTTATATATATASGDRPIIIK